MNSTDTFAQLANGTALPWAEVPAWPVAEFVQVTASALERGGRLCAWFGVAEPAAGPALGRAQAPAAGSALGQGAICLVAVVAFDAENILSVGRSEPFAGKYPALTPLNHQAHLFEREVWEQYGVEPEGHPWLKPVRRTAGTAPAVGEFFRVDGAEIHEVAVGPVHAGIIEPGHFRFQCAGEEVIHLEIALGYQHRGVETALAGGPHRATCSQMETVAGDTTIAHATAYATVLETLGGGEAPLRAQWLRSIALELERLANHTGDLGALANDVAFLPTSSSCGKIRGDFLNLTALLCGNRFGRGLVRPGGCGHDLEPARIAQALERLAAALAEVETAATWLWDAASVRARFENVGTVYASQAAEIGLVGPAARASGVVRDVRYDHPAGWHRFAQAPVAVWSGGDVLARARVRWLEIQRSGQFLREQLASPPEGAVREELLPAAPDTLAVTLVEGWRGEVCHVALTDEAGRFRNYKVVDPSFHNWTGLALALRGQAISDFPICNKSFNLSYCGFDL
jgi:Ni,Fe-hydrogenase III large subunit